METSRLSVQQEYAVKWMAWREGSHIKEKEKEGLANAPFGGILADDVGAGKTHIIGHLLIRHPLHPSLVVVPKSLVHQWVEKLRSCGNTCFTVLINRTAAARHGAIPESAKVILASISCFSCNACPENITKRVWGRVIVDEAHLIKNTRTRTHRSLAGLKAHARWAVTATPIQNCRADLLALAKFVGVRGDDAELVRESFMLRRVSEVAAAPAEKTQMQMQMQAMPGLTVCNIVLTLRHRWEAEVCAQVHAEGRASAASTETEAAIGAMSVGAMVRVLRCRQVATHLALYYQSIANSSALRLTGETLELNEMAMRARSMPASSISTKVGWLVEDILRFPDAKCIVFCEWSEEMVIVSEALDMSGVRSGMFNGSMGVDERDAELEYFRQTDGPRVLVAQVRCAAVGLDIQCASRVYLMRPHWNPAVEKQAIGRVHRQGQKKHVTVLRLIANGTIDQACMVRQLQKLTCITDVLHDDSMQRTLEGMETLVIDDNDGSKQEKRNKADHNTSADHQVFVCSDRGAPVGGQVKVSLPTEDASKQHTACKQRGC